MTRLTEVYQILSEARLVNLSHQIDENSPHFPALPSLSKRALFTLEDGFHVQEFTVVGQYGTHIDAPIHFVEGGKWLEEIPLEDLFLPLYVIDKSMAVMTNPNYELTRQDILDFEAEHGQIAKGSLISIAYPNWSKATGSPVRAVAYVDSETL